MAKASKKRVSGKPKKHDPTDEVDETGGGFGPRTIERWALAGALVAVPLAFATGFSRYEVLKLALLTVLGGIGLVAFAVDLCRGSRPRSMGGGLASVVAWLFVLAATLSLLWGPQVPGSTLGMMRWLLLFGVFALAAGRTGSWGWVAWPLVISGAATGALVVLGALGVSVLPAVPTGMAADAGAHGPFDHQVFAGAFLVVVGSVALYAAANTRSSLARGLALVAAIVIFLAVGSTGAFFTVLAIATLFLGLALSFARIKGQTGALAVWATTMLAVLAVAGGRFGLEATSVEAEGTAMPLRAEGLYEAFRIDGPENAVTDLTEWGFAWTQAMSIFEEARLLGEGAGSFAYYNGLAVDAEHPYYTSSRGEYHLHQSPPGLIAGLGAELGVVGLGLGLLFLVLVGWSTLIGLARPQDDQAAGAGFLVAAVFAAIAVLLVTPAAWHAGEGIAALAVLGLATRLEAPEPSRGIATTRRFRLAKSSFARFERWVMLGVPLLVLLGWGGWSTVRSTAADFLRQRGELYLMVRQNEPGIEALEAAVAFEPDDYRAHYYLGLTQYYTPTDEGRRSASRQHIEEAARLWPHDVRVQIQALKSEMHRGGLEMLERLEAAGSVRNQLLELRRRDPHNVDVLRQLADVQEALGDHDQAVAALLEATGLTDDEEELRMIHEQIGDAFSEQLDDPENALEHYRLALEYSPGRSPLAEHLLERIGFVEEWIRRGSRPAVETGHGGPDHEEDHADDGGGDGASGDQTPPEPPSYPLPDERAPDQVPDAPPEPDSDGVEPPSDDGSDSTERPGTVE